VSGRTLIRNAYVITMDQQLGNVAGGDILIEDGIIRQIARGVSVDPAGCEIIEANGMIAIPGLVDTHRHVWEAVIRGIGTDWSLLTYLRIIYFTGLGGTLRPQDVYIADLLGALEALNAGVTTMFDWSMVNSPEHADALVQGLKESGIRAVFGYGTPLKDAGAYWSMDSQLTHPEDCRRVKAQYFASDDQLVTMALAIRGAEFSNLDVAAKDIRMARELGVIASMHVGVGINGQVRSIEKLQKAGLLGPDLNFVHCTHMKLDEVRMIGDSGGSVSVTPEVELQMGHGFPATSKVLEAGFRPTLGVDVVVSTSGDMFSQMKFATQFARSLVNERLLERGEMPEQLTPLSTADALAFATIEGAKALKLDDKVGSLKPGKEADIVLLKTDDVNMFPVNNPLNMAALCSNVANVDSVFVKGEARKRHGRLVGVDHARIRRLAEESRDYVFRTWGPPEGAEPMATS
jgi:5-methylthioadenosine/S-adenosylhomocysteine deaminase